MIKGYYTATGYMGWIDSCGRYFLFATEDEYLEYVRNDAR